MTITGRENDYLMRVQQRRLKSECQKLIGLEPPTTRKVRVEKKILVTLLFYMVDISDG